MEERGVGVDGWVWSVGEIIRSFHSFIHSLIVNGSLSERGACLWENQFGSFAG